MTIPRRFGDGLKQESDGLLKVDFGTGSTQVARGSQLAGRTLATTAPTNGQVLTWNSSSSQWEPAVVPPTDISTLLKRDGTTQLTADWTTGDKGILDPQYIRFANANGDRLRIRNSTNTADLNVWKKDGSGFWVFGEPSGTESSGTFVVGPSIRFGLDTSSEVVRITDRLRGLSADSSGTPGNATQNTICGRAAFAAGATSVTITCDRITAASYVFGVLCGSSADATLTQIVRIVPAAGSVTFHGNAAATAATPFNWHTMSPLT